MEDHNNYFIKKRKNEEDGDESRMLNAMTAREKDSLLIHLVKGYPHPYDKELKDFKDIIKRNNSWKEIGRILNTTASDCQTRWARLRERYSREKKLREIETRSGSGSTMRQSFPLYEQMNFLFKFVKSRKSIINISYLTSKQIHPIKTSESTEKLGSSNISRNQIRSSNENDIINKSPKPVLKTVNASATVTSTSSSLPSALHSHSHSHTQF
ncbi:Transcription factor Adf-1 [Formica fusca]